MEINTPNKGRPSQVGEANHGAKLTEAEIRFIRNMVDTKKMRIGELAKRCGCSRKNIVLIGRRITWAHVPEVE